LNREIYMSDQEQRLVIWAGIPDGSLLQVKVEPGDYTVLGEGRLKHRNGVTPIRVGPRELVDRSLDVPIRRGDSFRMLIDLTYISPEPTRALIRARVIGRDGRPVRNTEGRVIEPFVGEYAGHLGGVSGQDELLLMVAGEP
jgi:hypothetical protein